MASTLSRIFPVNFWFLPVFVVVFIVIRLIVMSHWFSMNEKHKCPQIVQICLFFEVILLNRRISLLFKNSLKIQFFPEKFIFYGFDIFSLKFLLNLQISPIFCFLGSRKILTVLIICNWRLNEWWYPKQSVYSELSLKFMTFYIFEYFSSISVFVVLFVTFLTYSHQW